MVQEKGYDGADIEKLATAAVERLRWLGVSDDKVQVLLEKGLRRLENVGPRPPVDVSELEGKLQELIMHPAYYDRFHPKHKSVRAESGRLSAEIVRKKPLQIWD